MQEAGLIEVITTLHQGRHNIAYFGRTARGFLFESKKEKSKYDDYFAEASRFAKALNPKISEEKFKDLLAKFKKINQESDKLTKKWLQERAEFINKNNIDTATMYSFLRRINYNRKEMNLIMKEIADLLEFNLNY